MKLFVTALTTVALSCSALAAGTKKTELINDLCKKGIGLYLDLTPVFKDSKKRQLKGFAGAWDEELYLDNKGAVSVLMSSENVIYLYNESSDVAGDVYRCDANTGSISLGAKFRGHYPSCAHINEAIAAESNKGAVSYDYCKSHPEVE